MNKMQALGMKDGTLLLKINVLLRKEVGPEVEIEQEGEVEEEDVFGSGVAFAQLGIPAKMHARIGKVLIT